MEGNLQGALGDPEGGMSEDGSGRMRRDRQRAPPEPWAGTTKFGNVGRGGWTGGRVDRWVDRWLTAERGGGNL